MKIAARLTDFKGSFGLIWHFTYLLPTTLPEPALWATYEFLKVHNILGSIRECHLSTNVVYAIICTMIDEI